MFDNNKKIIETYNRIYEKLYRFDKKHVNKRKKTIKKNLKEIKVTNYKNLTVMDIGTGIQSYVFYLLNFKRIFHYDLNPRPVRTINALGIDNFKSELKDLSRETLVHKFDLIYLNGILHHIKKYKYFLNNIINNLTTKGKIFFRIYRSGSFAFFTVDFLRKIITNLEEFDNYILRNEKTLEPDDTISDMIDDLFVPNLYLFNVNNLINDFKKNGFKLIYKSKHKDYDHSSKNSNQGISLCFQNSKSQKKSKHNFTIKHLDQIQDITYKEHYILNNIKLINQIIKNINRVKKDHIFKFAVHVYKNSQFPHHKKKRSSIQNHKNLNIILKNFIRNHF